MAREDAHAQLARPAASRLRFSTATADDGAAIRQLLRSTPMRGLVSLCFEREPDYFGGANLAGGVDTTVLGFMDERLVCMGRCSVRDCWVDGVPRRVGYLAELRLDAAAAGRSDILRGGYRFFRENHASPGADLYFTSIAADNVRARRLLENCPRGLPGYKPLSEFVSVLIGVPRNPRTGRLRVESGSRAHVPEILSCLNADARRYQLSPVWTEERLLGLDRQGLPLEQFRLAREAGRLVACAALWDQRGFRQTVIRGYAPWLATARPLINLAGPVLGMPQLPPVGATLRHAFLSPLASNEEDPSLLTSVVESFFPRAAQLGIEWITVGFPASDPRLPFLRQRFFTRTYKSLLYSVEWDRESAPQWNGVAPPFLPDVALL